MKDITKHYGENTVLNGVSLSVKKGEIHALLGENGAGKSTLMNILFGMPVIHSTGGFEGKVLLDVSPSTLYSAPVHEFFQSLFLNQLHDLTLRYHSPLIKWCSLLGSSPVQ